MSEAGSVDVDLAEHVGVIPCEVEDVEVIALIEIDLGFVAAGHPAEWEGSDDGAFFFGFDARVEEEAFGAEEVVDGKGAGFESGGIGGESDGAGPAFGTAFDIEAEVVCDEDAVGFGQGDACGDGVFTWAGEISECVDVDGVSSDLVGGDDEGGVFG